MTARAGTATAGVGGPLVLMALGALVLVEPVLPGRSFVVRHLGETAVLRFAVLGLCLYTALLLWERHRTTALLRDLIADLRRLAEDGGRGGESAVGPRFEAVEILIAALGAEEAEVRQRAHAHLRRLTGVDLGPDPAAWRERLSREEAPPGS